MVPMQPLPPPKPAHLAVQGGTRAAPRQFNDRNREEPENYWPSAANCSYVVTLRDRASGRVIDELGELPSGRSGHRGTASWLTKRWACPCQLPVRACAPFVRCLEFRPCLTPILRRPGVLGGGCGPPLPGCRAVAGPDASLLHSLAVAGQEQAHGLHAAAAEGGAVTRRQQLPQPAGGSHRALLAASTDASQCSFAEAPRGRSAGGGKEL